MTDELHHECGVAALYLLDDPYHGALDGPCAGEIIADENVVTLIPRILLDLQSHGNLAAGVTCFQANRAQLLKTYKMWGGAGGIPPDAARAPAAGVLGEHTGSAAIGHTRYATCGLDDVRYAQPFERVHAACGSGSASPSTEPGQLPRVARRTRIAKALPFHPQ